jgi:LysM repeat protein
MTRLFLAFLLFFSLSLYSQTSIDSTTTINNVKYGVHEVKQGQTLFSLSKEYKVSFSLLKQLNQDKLQGLAIGDYVYIPLKGQNYANQQSVTSPTTKVEEEQQILVDTKEKIDGDAHEFTVPKGATVYGVCKKFSISKEDLFRWNPSVETEGLKEGQVIIIKELNVSDEKDSNSIDKDDDGALTVEAVKNYFSKNSNDSVISTDKVQVNIHKDSSVFHLAIMLPFQIANQNAVNALNKEENNKEKLQKETEISLEFYNGIQLALDSLKSLGLNAKVFVYDTKADTNEVKKIMSRKEIKAMDLIIGPLYAKNFEIAANKALEYDIAIASPFIKNNEIVQSNKKVIRCQPNFDSKLDRMLYEAERKHMKDKIILVYQTKNLEKAKLFERRLMAKALQKDSLIKLDIVLAEGVYQAFNYFNADTNTTNAIFILDNEESFTTRFTTKLHLRADDFSFQVYAMDELLDFKNIEIAVWDSLKMNVIGQMNADQGVVLDDHLYKKYFEKFYNEPSGYALLAYDIAFTLLHSCRYSNLFSPAYVVGKNIEGNALDFRFQYSGKDGGIYNNYATTFQYRKYQFLRKN